ncbi:type II toxin-antitoxin system RelE/ParE family toxin [Bacterioplanoides sp.]|uniref:type II toxin-antitoxin system RelE/ParE family toxin n=1 Tax=Bacterioplanoides sp. TaxID=2066072 RepID=UPI003B5B3982
MLRIHKQTKAEEDLVNIWLYSMEHWGVVQADQYLDQLNTALTSISINPEIGIDCSELRAGYRKLHVREHYIFYRLNRDFISVIRILGDEMNYQPILEND